LRKWPVGRYLNRSTRDRLARSDVSPLCAGANQSLEELLTMIDIRELRRNPDTYLARLARKRAEQLGRELVEIDAAWRRETANVEALRAEQKRSGKPSPDDLGDRSTKKERLQEAQALLTDLERRRKELLDRIPNPPADDVPDGGEDDFTVLREVGDRPFFAFPARDHLDLTQVHGWIDTARGTKVSGSRFVYRVGDLALLEVALYRYAVERLVRKGHTLVLPPVLVRAEAMYGTGFFPTDAVNIYEVERDGLYLAGTSEVPLAAFHAGEILPDLPIRYVAYSTCFRREAGAAGKDTRGMFRVHQFDKVEMFVYCSPDSSRDEHERLLAIEEELVQELGIPYRVIKTAAGDLGASAVKKYDIEAWFPGQGHYREITSTSNTTDFQSRRLDIRYRNDGKHAHVHTVNGTAVTARAMLAILENFQEADGSVVVPAVLNEFGAPRRLSVERASTKGAL
jgi:seryl-tRNA synthetase